MSHKEPAKLTQIAGFDEIIDARSPAEYAEDHLPGAISCPVLDDEERARVGTLYKQDSPFAARKIGAALVARNIASHIEQRFADRPREWRPLVYCWRGGQRSGAFTHILRQIGWDAQRLEGGYKYWRRHIVEQLAQLPGQLRWQVIAGSTGSAKSRLLEALQAQGAQVLHLEQLAAHKGSVLGVLPDQPQPSQKAFESAIYQALSSFDSARPVFVESESRRIGQVQLPDAIHLAIRSAPMLRLEAPLTARIEFLLRDYDYFLNDPGLVVERLEYLRGLQSHERIDHWQQLAAQQAWESLIGELLSQHYDPLYRRSQARSPSQPPTPWSLDSLNPQAIDASAAALLKHLG